jgi:hypothetical protein
MVSPMDFRKTVLGSVALGSLIALAVSPPWAFAVPTKHAATEEKSLPPADVAIGGEVVMRLRSSAGGRTPAERAADITDRLTRLVAVPDLTPSDVVVYTPDHKPPVIYVLGRKLITVDDSTAVASGAKPIDLATKWAKQLQQVLPRVDIRLPNEPEPVVPAAPPLTVTSDFNQLGGDVGDVMLHDKLVMRLRGPQPHGLTAAERADMIGAWLASAIHAIPDIAPADIKAVAVPPAPKIKTTSVSRHSRHRRKAARDAESSPTAPDTPAPAASTATVPSAKLMVGKREIITVTPADAASTGIASPLLLAQGWAKNIRNVVFPPPKPAPPDATPQPSTPISPQSPTSTPAPPPPSLGAPSPSPNAPPNTSP